VAVALDLTSFFTGIAAVMSVSLGVAKGIKGRKMKSVVAEIANDFQRKRRLGLL